MKITYLPADYVFNVAGRVDKDPIRPPEVHFLANSVVSTILLTAGQNVRRWVTAVEACATEDFDLVVLDVAID